LQQRLYEHVDLNLLAGRNGPDMLRYAEKSAVFCQRHGNPPAWSSGGTAPSPLMRNPFE
jgi:hypothetical protein